MINYLKQFLLWVLPHTCVLCKEISDRTQDLCKKCLSDLPVLKQGCRLCANVMPNIEAAFICGQCLQKSPLFACTHALFLYQPPVMQLILDLKFQHTLAHARLFGELLTEKILHDWYASKPLPSAIIPIPLHPQRLKERGFNQAIEIARPIAKTLQIPLFVKDIIRKKHTIAQATLPAEQRKRNMRDAFLIKRDLSNQHIAVIDDVITTGSTIHEFCRALKKRGAGQIDVWCCARPFSII